jgi:hypothetical protein
MTLKVMGDVVEVSRLCEGLEQALQRGLTLAGGNADQVVLVLDLDETAFTPESPDALGTSKW